MTFCNHWQKDSCAASVLLMWNCPAFSTTKHSTAASDHFLDEIGSLVKFPSICFSLWASFKRLPNHTQTNQLVIIMCIIVCLFKMWCRETCNHRLWVGREGLQKYVGSYADLFDRTDSWQTQTRLKPGWDLKEFCCKGPHFFHHSLNHVNRTLFF